MVINISVSNVSVAQLKRAVFIREQIERLEHELAGILGETRGVAGAGFRGGRRTMSAAARAKIAASQRSRWAQRRRGGAAGIRLGARAGGGRRKLSPATRAKIAAAARLRWAKAKAANRRTLAAF